MGKNATEESPDFKLFLMRLRLDEDAAITAAAEAEGVTASEWIREQGRRAAAVSDRHLYVPEVRATKRAFRVDPDLAEVFSEAANASRLAGADGTVGAWLRGVCMAAIGRTEHLDQLDAAAGRRRRG